VIGVLAGSSLLNAAYFLPLLYRMWFKTASAQIEGSAAGISARPDRAARRHRLRRAGRRASSRLGAQPARLGDADRRAEVLP
jgi:hypothetical protein